MAVYKFIFIWFLLFSQFIYAQKDLYVSALSQVENNIHKNYDSIVNALEDYYEFAYNNTSKEVISAVQINALRRRSGNLITQKKNLENPSGSYFLYGNIYEIQKNYGYSSFLEIAFGGNAYSYPESDRVDILSLNAIDRIKEIMPKTERNNTPCAIYNILKESSVYYEVKDTTYKHIDCILLRAIKKAVYILDENASEKQKESTGNWNKCYETTIITDIINKSDNAILMCSNYTVWTNDSNEHRTYYHITRYEKSGNHYYQTYYEQRMPRLFPGFRAGFNELDIYTLIIRKSEDTKMDKYQEKELGIHNLIRIRPEIPYNSFLKKEKDLNDNIQIQWNNYWSGVKHNE